MGILGRILFSTVADYALMTIPMFILMACFSSASGLKSSCTGVINFKSPRPNTQTVGNLSRTLNNLTAGAISLMKVFLIRSRLGLRCVPALAQSQS